jgi:hypothetical protein
MGAHRDLTHRSHEADRIVAEVNNGGDMVEATVRMVDPNVAYRFYTAPVRARCSSERFAPDSPLEGSGFELPVPLGRATASNRLLSHSSCHGIGGMFAASGTIIMSDDAPPKTAQALPRRR